MESFEERLKRLRDLVELTDQKLKGFYSEAKESLDAAKVGNGWFPEEVREQVMAFKPIPSEAALQAAEEKKADLFGLLGLFRKPNPQDVQLVNGALWWYPYWIIEGFHAVFYFRPSAYKVSVREDVMATIVEGKTRDLIGEEKLDSMKALVPAKLDKVAEGIERLLIPKPKYFLMDDAMEFAYYFKEGALYLDAYGNESKEIKGFFEKKTAIIPISGSDDLKADGVKVNIQEQVEPKEMVVKRLRDKIVKPPGTPYTRIWSNQFEVVKLQLIYSPLYIFQYRFRDKVKELRIDGAPAQGA